jgi:predicted dehydrogenase
MAKKKIGWGVIGAGGIARRRLIPEGLMAAKNAKLVAVMDANQDAAAEVAKEFKADLCATEKELLAHPGVDAVYIATPNFLHKKQVLMAAKAGKHVLCEKPLANTAAEIRAMIKACKKARVKLGVGFMMRFNVYHQAIKEMIKKKVIGKPVMARGQMTCWYPPMKGVWRQEKKLGGGGALPDMGSHVIDIMEQFFGKTTSVRAVTANRVHKYEVEDTCIGIYEFANGMPAVIDVSFAIPDETSEFVLEIYGSKGAIKATWSLAQGPGGEFRLLTMSDVGGYDAQQKAGDKGSYQPWKLKEVNTYLGEVEAFSQSIIDKKKAPVPAIDGLWNHMVVEATYKAAETGQTVKMRKLR